MAKITILGSGSWGCALADALYENNHDVLLWTKLEKEANEINTYKTNKFYFGKDVKLNDNFKVTTDLKKALDHSEYIIYVIPTKFARDVFKEMNKYLTKNNKKYLINASKGIDPDTLETINEVSKSILNDKIKDYCILTGPSHAEEVIVKKLTMLVSASHNIDLAKMIQRFFNNNNYLRVYTSCEVDTIEFMSSAKNVIAIGAGFLKGSGQGDNAAAALITRSIKELAALGLKMGHDLNTIYGLTGLGDLIVTATSKHSRNFQFGYNLSKDPSKIKEVLSDMKMVAEGVRSTKPLYKLFQKYEVEGPIVESIYKVLYTNEKIIDFTNFLKRDLKQEF